MSLSSLKDDPFNKSDLGYFYFFFFQAEDGIRDLTVTGVQTCALPISVANAVGAKSTEDHRMHRANPRAGQHGNRGLGNIREVNDDAIALFDLVPFQHEIGRASCRERV